MTITIIKVLFKEILSIFKSSRPPVQCRYLLKIFYEVSIEKALLHIMYSIFY